MSKSYAFLNIKDISIKGFLADVDFKNKKSKILHKAEFENDISQTESLFLKNQTETEFAILKVIDKLENDSGDEIFDVVIVLPDSCFSINKTALKHNFKFKLKPTKLDIFGIKKQIWQHFESKKSSNEITNIENIAYFNPDTNERILNLEDEILQEVVSIDLVSYLRHEYISKITNISKNCNIKPSLIIPASFAMNYGVLTNSGEDKYLIIDISHLESTSCIVGDLGIEKFSTIKFGIYSIAIEIAKKFNISTRDASKILKLYIHGMGDVEYSDALNLKITNKPLLNKTILIAIEHLFKGIAKDISHSKALDGVTKIIIDGEFSKLDYVRNLAKEVFDRPVYLVNFDQEIKEKEYNASIGAVLKFIQSTKDIIEIGSYSYNIKNKIRRFLHAVAFKIDKII